MYNKISIAIGNDHAGFDLKNFLMQKLTERACYYRDYGCHTADRVDYPDYANLVCENVSKEIFKVGILICGTGIGMSIAANRHLGIRCAVVSDPLTAELSRLHNDSNVLALGARIIGDEMAWKCVSTWITTAFEGGRHEDRIKKLG